MSSLEQLEARCLLAADVLISEIMYHPSSALTPRDQIKQEYIEIYNKGDATANLNGWQFTAGVNFTFPNITLPAGQYLVIAADTAAFHAKYPAVTNYIGGWYDAALEAQADSDLKQQKLGDGGEKITLKNAAAATIDSVEYASQGDEWAARQPGPADNTGSNAAIHYGWDWFSVADGNGKSLELMNLAVSNAYGQNWSASTPAGGTPGAVNSVNTTNIAPLITELKQTPVLPKAADPVVITARISDELAGFTATVNYRTGTGAFLTVPMFDDGAHGDEYAGDGIYGGTIPAQVNTNLTVIEFYVSATDAASNVREFPKAGLATQAAITSPVRAAGYALPRAVYQVNNSYVNPATLAPGALQVGYIVMTAAEKLELDTIFTTSSINGPNSRMAGTFIAVTGTGVQVFYDVGIRNRGHGSRSGPPNNFDIAFSNQGFNDQSNLVLNKDTIANQVVGAAIFDMADLPAFHAQGFALNYNGAAQGGQANRAFQEAVDGNFVSNHFANDPGGNLYSMVRDEPGHINSGGSADLHYINGTESTYKLAGYVKQSNITQDDFSDIFNLIKKINNVDGAGVVQPVPAQTAGYLASISGVIDVKEWLRFLALNMLLSNKESGLYTGVGDDYEAYRGVTDPRFKLVPHDLDSILNIGGGANASTVENIFANYSNMPAFAKFLTAPEIAPMYVQTILDVLSTSFNHTVLDPVIDRLVATGVVDAGSATTMKTWITNRTTGVLGQIKTAVTATSALVVTNGYPKSTVATATITGFVPMATAKSVLVNNQLANTWTPSAGAYTRTGVTLTPGINRVLVQAFDGFNGTGNEVGRSFIDIWYDDTTVVSIAGSLPAGTTTWTAAAGPYRVTADLTVPAGSTLVIQPGTSVYFDAGAKLIVNGTLTAVGTDLQHIRFTRTPGNAVNWGGIQFTDTLSDNQMAFFEQEFGDSAGTSVTVTNSQVTFNRGTWLNTTKQILNASNSSFNLTNSTLPAAVAAEMVHVVGVPAAGFALVQGNTFGATNGKFDVIGITGGNRPDAIVQILDNTFNGSGDDILDFHGADGHVENNVFLNVATTVAADTNNAIALGGDPGVPANISEVTAARNYFYNVAHVYLVKDGSFVTSTNNTAVNVLTGVANFDEPGVATSPGQRATIDGDIYFAAPTLFQNVNAAQLTVSRSMTPGASAYPGVGNSNADPRLTKTASVTNPRVDFVLKPGSPAIGTGPNGVNMGALVAAGATITGEPPVQTTQTTATLVVGGAGINSYKYRVNGGLWSAETPIATPISLAGLTNGAYTVQVAGRNSAGVWQADAAATNSKTWTVNSALVRLLINEVLANNISVLNNAGTFPDAIELYNAGANTINLAGMSISDTSATPTKFVFPVGTTLLSGQYLTLYADPASAAPGIHLGFALSSFGEGVYLYNTVASGGALIDSVEFGQQAANLSIGRVGQDQHWALNTPTIGSANSEAKTGNAATIKINEWLASEDIRMTDDFLELYNPDTLPVSMGGFSLTDDTLNQQNKFQLWQLSFIAAGGFVTFTADNNVAGGLEHLNFGLSSVQQVLGLYDANLNVVDKQIYFTQTTDYAQGPSPDGATAFAFYKLPTPGLANSNSTNVQGLAVIDNLRITEIMYNPLGTPNTEFIELRNNSASVMNLAGVRITGGVDFTFPAINLAAGAYVLVVADQTAFQSRYGTSLNVAGQYTGSLSNGGEGLLLELPVPFDIGALRFDYSDAWYPTTDGLGNSLAINSATAVANTWGTRGSWHASGLVGGSPGLVDPATTAGLTGHAFRDLNNNGIQDGADPAIGSLTAAVYNAGADGQIGGGDDTLVRTGTSDGAGDYSFFGLPAGNYFIQFTPPPGYAYTMGNQGADDNVDSDADQATGRTAVFALSASQYDTSRDVGLVPALVGASVVGRKLFYNNSSFDGNNPAAGASDDAAIATDKTALLNSSTATFANYSSYSRGINGIMVDIQGLAGTPVASDFVFRVGNNNLPTSWAFAPAPQSITVRAGAGTGGSSRVELIWADGAIKNQWLQVIIPAGGNLGLVHEDVFYFGNAPGETGSSAANAIVNATDEIATRNNGRSFTNLAPATFPYDFNRDGFVNATDQIIARTGSTTAATALQLINTPLELTQQDAIVGAVVDMAWSASVQAAQATAYAKSANLTKTTAVFTDTSVQSGDDAPGGDSEAACPLDSSPRSAAVDAIYATDRDRGLLMEDDLLELIVGEAIR